MIGIYVKDVDKVLFLIFKQEFVKFKIEDFVHKLNILIRNWNYVLEYLLIFVNFLFQIDQINVFFVLMDISYGKDHVIHLMVVKLIVIYMDAILVYLVIQLLIGNVKIQILIVKQLKIKNV